MNYDSTKFLDKRERERERERNLVQGEKGKEKYKNM
jgi:hypothetical protein